MKWLMMMLLSVVVNSVHAQSGRTAKIGWLDKFPVTIQAETFIDSMFSGPAIHVLSPRVRIGIFSLAKDPVADAFFQINAPDARFSVAKIEFRVLSSNNAVSRWRPVTNIVKNASDEIFIDTAISPSNDLVVQFRLIPSDQIIQTLRIYRPDLTPAIFRYKESKGDDTLGSKTVNRMALRRLKELPGFIPLTSNLIKIAPGGTLQCLVERRLLNSDSCLRFRVRKANDGNAKWTNTGHIITIDSLHPGNRYTLELKYKDSGKIASYEIDNAPYWYQQAKWIVFLAGIAIILIAIAALLFYRRRLSRERIEKEMIREQLQRVQSQLNPHFVYNALSSIEGLVANKENKRANEYLNNFSHIMRETVKNSHLLWISLAEDLAMLDKYIRLEQLRFEFRYRLYVDPELDLQSIEFPPMLLQPSVENAVKHGVSGLGFAGLITISFERSETHLRIRITDNGISGEANIYKPGHGTSFTQERINNLRKLFPKEKIEYKLEFEENGTTATFFFENWLL